MIRTVKGRIVSPIEPLHSFTTAELLAEIKRRSLACMLVIVRAEESGDTWRYALKGSPILLGAMKRRAES